MSLRPKLAHAPSPVDILTGNFAVAFPGQTCFYLVSVGEAAFAFAGISGLDIGFGSSLFEDGVGGWCQIPNPNKTLNVALKRGLVLRKSQFYNWISSASSSCTDKKDISISLMKGSAREALMTWHLINVTPTKSTATSRNTSSTEVEIEELSLLAERLTLHYH